MHVEVMRELLKKASGGGTSERAATRRSRRTSFASRNGTPPNEKESTQPGNAAPGARPREGSFGVWEWFGVEQQEEENRRNDDFTSGAAAAQQIIVESAWVRLSNAATTTQ